MIGYFLTSCLIAVDIIRLKNKPDQNKFGLRVGVCYETNDRRRVEPRDGVKRLCNAATGSQTRAASGDYGVTAADSTGHNAK